MDLAQLIAAIEKGLVTIKSETKNGVTTISLEVAPPPPPADDVDALIQSWLKASAGMPELLALSLLGDMIREYIASLPR